MLTVMGILLRNRRILAVIGREFCGVLTAFAALLNVAKVELLGVRSFGLASIIFWRNIDSPKGYGSA